MRSRFIPVRLTLCTIALSLFACSSGSTVDGSGGSGGRAGTTTSATTGTSGAKPDAGQALAFGLDDGLDNPGMDGLAIRTGWGALEPTEGAYSWSTLDAKLDQVMAAGKLATLHVVGAVFPNATPPWLYASGAVSFSDGKSTLPVPWDAVYLQKWKSFLPALADHLTSKGYTSVLRNVSIAVPVPEMNLISCSPQKNTLDVAGSIPYDPKGSVKGTMLQLYCAGLAAGGSYFEVYKDDLANPDPEVQKGIAAIRDPSSCPP